MSPLHATRLKLERIAREAQQRIDDGIMQYDEILRVLLSEVTSTADTLALRVVAPDGCDHVEQVAATQHAVFASILKHTGIAYAQIAHRSRPRRLTVPRQVAMWALRTFTGMPLKDIAASTGRRDHSTVIYAVAMVDRDRRASARGMSGLGRATLSRLVEADIRGTP